MDHINNELPICSVITGDLNVRCSEWCNKNITNLVDREIDTHHRDIYKLSTNLTIL